MALEVIDASSLKDRDAVRAYAYLVYQEGWCPRLTLPAVIAAQDLVGREPQENRPQLIVRVASRIFQAAIEIEGLRSQSGDDD